MRRIRRKWARNLVLIAAAGLLGLITTVGVSWWFALCDVNTSKIWQNISANDGKTGTFQPLVFMIGDEYRTGLRRLTVTTPERSLDSEKAGHIAAALAANDHTPGHMLPPEMGKPGRPLWLPWLGRPGPEDGQVETWSARATGWPMLCLCSRRVERKSSTPVTINGSWVVYSATFVNTSDPDCGTVPVIPIWTGLVVNTAAYASAWGLLVLGLMGLKPMRRAMRRRKGLCVQCGYERGGIAAGAACPECGHVPPVTSAT